MIRYKCPNCGTDALLANEMLYKFITCRACHWPSQVFGPSAIYQADPRGNETIPPMFRAFMPDFAKSEKPIPVTDIEDVDDEDLLIDDDEQAAQIHDALGLETGKKKNQTTSHPQSAQQDKSRPPKPSDMLGMTTHASDDKYRSKHDKSQAASQAKDKSRPPKPSDMLGMTTHASDDKYRSKHDKSVTASQGNDLLQSATARPTMSKPSDMLGTTTHAADDKYRSKYDKTPKPQQQQRPITQAQQPQPRQSAQQYRPEVPPVQSPYSVSSRKNTGPKIVAPEARAAMILAVIGIFLSCLAIGGLFSFISLIASKAAGTKIKEFPEYYEGENVLVMARVLAVIGLIISVISFARFVS